MKPLSKTISFIIVNYNSTREIHRCLHDLSVLPNIHDHEVIIVNNDSDFLFLKNFGFHDLKLIEVNKNIGYGAANNIGILQATNPFICLLNPDTHSFSQNFIDIFHHVDDRTIVSPRINNEDATPQEWSNGDRITLTQLIKNNCGLHTKPWESHMPRSVHWVSGAALCTTAKLLHKLKGFDESFFLYFEDVDLCERTHQIGGNVYYLPQFSVVHTGGQSSKKTMKIQKKWYYRSQDHFFKKHLGSAQAFVLRMCRLFHVS